MMRILFSIRVMLMISFTQFIIVRNLVATHEDVDVD